MLITRIRLTLMISKSEHFLDTNRALSTDTYFYHIKRILLISDTHSYFGEDIAKHINDVDEVWHAGNWGHGSVSTGLGEDAVVRGVYGNIDTLEIRKKYPKELIYTVEGLTVYMIHIGGYPGRYEAGVRDALVKHKPDLFICGHSHICKVMKDKNLDLVHFNPGAIGKHGFHTKRTMMKFNIENGKLFDINIIEYERN